jgi:WD40 repeat protein
LRGHENWVRGACFSPDGVRILTASSDGTARLWDAGTGGELAALRGRENWGRSACFSPDGARILAASEDRTARLWDAGTGQEVARIALDAAVTGLNVHGGAIALGEALGRIHVFDADGFLRGECLVGG